MKSQSLTDEFCYLLRVRYADCDMQGIVFNVRYAEYIDVAVTEFMRDLWKGGFHVLIEEGYDTHVVSMHLDWKASAKFDDVLCIVPRITEIKNSSFVVNFDLYNEKTSELLVEAYVVYVMISLDDHKKTTIPDKFRQMMNEPIVGHVNHAGEIK